MITKHWTPRLINNIQAHRTRSAIGEIKKTESAFLTTILKEYYHKSVFNCL